MGYDAKYFIAPNGKLDATAATAESVKARLAALGIYTGPIIAIPTVSGPGVASYVPLNELEAIVPDGRYNLQVTTTKPPGSKNPEDITYRDVAELDELLTGVAAGKGDAMPALFNGFYPDRGDQAALNVFLNDVDVRAVIAAKLAAVDLAARAAAGV